MNTWERQARLHERFAELYREQAKLDEELGRPESLSQLTHECAEDHRRWADDARRMACSTH